MSIHYTLLRNKLVDDPHAYRAVVHRRGTADLEQIIKEICRRETTVGESDVRGVLTLYFKVIEEYVEEGKNIITPQVLYRVTLRGVFDRASDGFDPSRHQLTLRLRPTKRLKRVLRDVSVVKGDALEIKPYLREYSDITSASVNGVLTPGGMGELTGRRLRFAFDDPEQGIFFIDAEGSAVRAEMVGKNRPSELFFIVPELAPGSYKLEVHATVNGSNQVRSGALEGILTVGESVP